MPEMMTRGKNQVLFNYLPERTIEFPKGAAIARVTEVDGREPTEINLQAVVRRVAKEARAWDESERPGLTDSFLSTVSNFQLVSPESASSELFPRVFWCQNRACGRVFDYQNANDPPRAMCRACGTGLLVQMRFVTVHKCGFIGPLTPPNCERCNSRRDMALDTRGSERMQQFRWVCRSNTCGGAQQIVRAGWCARCDANGRDRMLDIQLHRAGKTYFVHNTTLLNIPLESLSGLFNTDERNWAVVVSGKFADLPNLAENTLADVANSFSNREQGNASSVPTSALTDLTLRMSSGEITAEQMAEEIRRLAAEADATSNRFDVDQIAIDLRTRTGVDSSIWQESGYELLESILPNDLVSARVEQRSEAWDLMQDMKFSSVQLLNDFPIITASYAFSRTDYRPNTARLNPFPRTRRTDKIPIYVDRIQADAIRIKLCPDQVLNWIVANGLTPSLPNGSDPTSARDAYFVQLFHGRNLFDTISADERIARMVFGALHTMTHLCIRQATLLCGLERTSLSEYLLPHSLESIIYCNHRDGATIGALTAMFEQSITEWMNAVYSNRRCVYDPVCSGKSNSCHACTHLAETSCRYFNNNLSRALLFGGNDSELGEIETGLFEIIR